MAADPSVNVEMQNSLNNGKSHVEEYTNVAFENDDEVKKMDKPLVANAAYVNDHGTVNPVTFITSPDEDETIQNDNGAANFENGAVNKTAVPRTLETMLAERKVDNPTTNCETMMHILKGNIGTGILAMPEALKNSGLMFGTIGVLVIGVICVHCMHVLVKCARELYVRMCVTTLDYMDVAYHSFRTGPPRIQKLSKPMKYLTMFFLCLTQFGFCCVYYLFVAQNCEQVFNYLTGVHWSYRIYMLILLPLLIGLNFIRKLKFLAYVSTIANVLQMAAFVMIFYCVLQDLPPSSSRKNFATFQQLPLWFGTAIYAFEGISLVLPLENKMKTPQDFGGCTGVLNTGLVIVASLYAAIGFFGYLKYGEDVKGSVSLNIELESVIGQVVRLTYAIAILLTYMLQMYVPVKILFPVLKSYLPSRYRQHEVFFECLFRTFLVLLTFALAAATDQLGPMISLVGALSGSFLAVIFPPILEMVTFWNDGLSKPSLVKDILISAFGVLGFLTGTYASIHVIIYPPAKEE